MDPREYIERSERYLAVAAEWRVEEARRFVADDAEFVWPGAWFASIDEQIEASRGRYRRIAKVHEDWDVLTREDGTVAVYSLGTLTGVNPHGVEFSGIRYIDRIVYRDGLVVLHQVWNDLAVSGVLERTSPA